MGSSSSKALDSAKSQPYREFTEHPLLMAIDNPINRFCDDFASSLTDDPQSRNPKMEIPISSPELQEIGGYTVVSVIGKGADAVVYEAVEKRSAVHLAIKQCKQVKFMENGVPREYEISRTLDHPNCMTMRECFQDQNGEFILVMPLSRKGELKWTNSPAVTIAGGIQLLYQIGGALAHMHSHNIVHRDIKPGNIVMLDDGYCLIDYSVSARLNSPDESLSGIVGTSVFMSPEISNNLYAPKPADVWALGITAYVLIFGKCPYNLSSLLHDSGRNPLNVSKIVSGVELTFPETPVVPNEVKQILSGMLEKDPAKRMTADELAQNEWLQEKYIEWQRVLEYMRGA